MCGIAGIWDLANRKDWSNELDRMLGVIEHRGPDGYGVYKDRERAVYLGHKRLSILDLSENGKQPMREEKSGMAITYNGEVYNFREIRPDLEKLGHRFISNTDTEVILRSFISWGVESVQQFRGMFAYAVWDERERAIYLMRDRAGVKPLYYYHDKDLLIFSSELRALLSNECIKREIDGSALAHYFQFGYISAPRSIFSKISVVPPGHYLKICATGKATLHKYWDIIDFYKQGREDEKCGKWVSRKDEDVEEELEEILSEAFRYRLVSDVPVGVFLSGGIDSSLLSAILSKREGIDLNTFTIGYEDNTFNEAEYAKRTAERLGTNHTELYCGPETSLALVDRIADIYDEPFGDNSAIPTYIVSELARKNVKVALSADGADELFCGYSRYSFVARYGGMIGRMPGISRYLLGAMLGSLSPRLVDGIYGLASVGRQKRSAIYEKLLKVKYMLAHHGEADIYEAACTYWGQGELKQLLVHYRASQNGISGIFEKLGEEDIIHKMMALDFKKYMMDDVLTKVDRASMAVSLEAREPFLDHKIAEYAARLPLKYKYRNGESKYILKRILFKYLPESDFRRPKQGFSAPVGTWLKGALKEHVHYYLDSQRIGEQGIFDPEQVRLYVKDFYDGGRVSALNIWYLLVFQMWYKKWLQ